MKAFKVFAWLLLLTGVCSAQTAADDAVIDFALNDAATDLHIAVPFDCYGAFCSTVLYDVGPNDFVVDANDAVVVDDPLAIHSDGDAIVNEGDDYYIIEDDRRIGMDDFTVAFWATFSEDPGNGEGYDAGNGVHSVGLWRKGNGAACGLEYYDSTSSYYMVVVMYEPNSSPCTNSKSVAFLDLGTSFDVSKTYFVLVEFEVNTSITVSVYDPTASTPLVGTHTDDSDVYCYYQTQIDWTVGTTHGGASPADTGTTIDNFIVWDGLLSSGLRADLLNHVIHGDDFIRGDANQDGTVDSADITVIANYVTGSVSTNYGCLDSYDADGNDALQTADYTYVAAYLYSSGPPPPAPFSGCGFETALDSITCVDHDYCD